ncbi:hypothetical protein MT414_14160 [Mammaliicoccus sciuri]|uniref:hypothetical protein n=1 Tax=Mammaliicoccus sciuri TaxID=1296 RepID=UPI001FB5587B|nr:hypothetical protein [Mammaliicoccus sciuri]MCJ1763159.1 hypothetical protein [Mammaliicoccus sciuri]WQJ50683.1 hypothetical protein P3U25_05455 [Mammaliicoccus sciuri]
MIPITVEDIMERLNCSEAYAQKFMRLCHFDESLIRSELARQIHKRETTPAIIINKPMEVVTR